MNERLEKLRKRLGVQWKELAELLGISVPMLGCLRRGERNPSEKLLARLDDVEAGKVALQTASKERMAVPMFSAAERDVLLKRIADLENQIATALETINNQSRALAQGRTNATPASGACGGVKHAASDKQQRRAGA